jgi:DNA-binding GntR family transcriptional regulator
MIKKDRHNIAWVPNVYRWVKGIPVSNNTMVATVIRLDDSRSIREQVYYYVRNLILDGKVGIKDRLVEAQLAKEFNISRTPVREALHSLERDGLLEAIPRVGYQLRNMSWKEVEDVCEMRIVNETLAVKWAIQNITPGFVESLEENIWLTEEAVRKKNPRLFVELDGKFHKTLQKGSGSEILLKYCMQLRRHMLLWGVRSIYNEETVLAALKGHKAILNCIKRCAEDEVSRVIREHINYAKQKIKLIVFSDT